MFDGESEERLHQGHNDKLMTHIPGGIVMIACPWFPSDYWLLQPEYVEEWFA